MRCSRVAASKLKPVPKEEKLNIFFSHMARLAILAIYGHIAIGPYMTNMAMWGVPEKGYQNATQQC